MSTLANRERRVTWKELCELEPRLLNLYSEVSSIKDEGGEFFCANAVWYGRGDVDGFKHRLVELVGFRRRHDGSDPRLGTSLAYDIAYHKIYDALPDCRDCACVALWELEIQPRLAGAEEGR